MSIPKLSGRSRRPMPDRFLRQPPISALRAVCHTAPILELAIGIPLDAIGDLFYTGAVRSLDVCDHLQKLARVNAEKEKG